MRACTILVMIYVAMTILSAVVRMTKIVVIRGSRVIGYLSGTPPGFSLSARFLAAPRPSGGCLKIGPIQTGARPPRCIEKRNAGREITTPSPVAWPYWGRGYALLIGLFVWLITFNTNIPPLGVRLVAILASVVALYNTAGLTSPVIVGGGSRWPEKKASSTIWLEDWLMAPSREVRPLG